MILCSVVKFNTVVDNLQFAIHEYLLASNTLNHFANKTEDGARVILYFAFQKA